MTREAGAQKFHLVGQHIVVGQVEKFILIGYEGNCQQFHIGFFGQSVGFTIIAATAAGNHIGPDIFATP